MINPGTVLDNRYEIIQTLGKGGFGTVYKAQDKRLNTVVAIKGTFHQDPDFLSQFQREAHMLARMNHPSLTAVTDYFVEDNVCYLVMQYVPGEDLEEHLARQPQHRIGENETLTIIRPILNALEYLHTQNPPIIHRDIKPANIRINPDGNVYLVDFGLAKVYDNPQKQTVAGAQALTPGFAPLEQYGGGITEPRSDLYALGATMYVMLSGVEELPEAPGRLIDDTLLPLRQHNPSVSPKIEQVVAQLMSVKVEDRHPDIASVRKELLQTTRPVGTPPPQAAQPSQPAPPPQPSQPAPAPAPAPASQPAPAQPRSCTPWVIVVVIVVLLLVGGGVAFVYGSEWFAQVPTFTPTPTPAVSSGTTPSPDATPPPPDTPTPTQPASTADTATPEPPDTTSTATVADALPPGSEQVDNAIVFDSDRDFNPEIYLLRLDTNEQTRLTNSIASDTEPAWSPDGTRIVFVSGRHGNDDIFVMNADGTEQTRLTDDPATEGYPAWSPDGSRIAFHVFQDGNWDIYVMNADGSERTRLPTSDVNDEAPAWSPDSTRIAFQSRVDNNYEIFVMNADGTEQKRLTENQGVDELPAWSPDGTRIAFASSRGGMANIYVMNADGSAQRQLTGEGGTAPRWSPDGKQLVFVSNRDGDDELYVMNADGSAQTQLTENAAGDSSPDWSPGS